MPRSPQTAAGRCPATDRCRPPAWSAPDWRHDHRVGSSRDRSVVEDDRLSPRALSSRALGSDLPFRLRAWDGTETGPDGGPVLVVRSRRALRRLLFRPGELGIARAYVVGDIDVDGDLGTNLAEVWGALRKRPEPASRLTPVELAQLALRGVRLGAVGLPPKPPRAEARLSGRLHSVARDRAVVSHHYDRSNDFYRLLLDPSMAYSCAYWTSEEPGYGLAEAQQDKLDLVCGKLALEEGSRLLDLGCGWGSLSPHAASHYGATVTALTLSAEQAVHLRARVDELGLDGRVEVLLSHYREIPAGEHDAVASIELGEHVGHDNYPGFVDQIVSHVRPGGRALVQQMSRPSSSPSGGPFIEAYIAPDMHMVPLGATIGLLEAAGREVIDVEAIREHYVRTCWAWYENLDQHRDDLVRLVGDEIVRV